TLCWFHGQCLKLLLLVFSYFMVTFPAVIESGSEAKLCVSLLKPNETLQLTVYLLHKKQNRTLLQERVEEEFHRCSQFKVRKHLYYISDVFTVKGENFLMTETRKVVFKSYKPLTFIQTDKPIYNPGQKVNFRIVTMNANFVPLRQEFYSKLINVCIFCGTTKDNNKNRIGQWTNVSSTGLILQLSHQLNSEASEGQYTLKAIIEDRWITHHFTVKKYVLPKFEVTLKAPKEHSVVTTHSGKPIPNKEVYLLNGYSWQSKLLLNLTTDDNGLASFTIDAPADPDTEIRFLLLFNNIRILALFQVLSKGVIVHHGYEKVEVKDSRKVLEGSVSFKLSVIPEMAPVVQVLVYGVLPSENVIAASKNFNVEKCFTNKVSLQFSPSEAVPGEENSLQLSALPGSLCALSAVDQSVFILEPGKRLDPDTVMFKTEFSAQTHSPHGANVIMERREEFVETVRNVFPETWIWQLAEVGDSGSAQVPVTVPDTITTWEMDTFCLSSRGVGVAPAAQLRVFQPFFLELSLPYSIIRGEEFELKATVFNYLSKCIMVKVTPAPSSDYTLKASSSDEQYSSCLCANGRKTFRWTLVPSVLGERVLNVTVSAAAEPSQTVCDNEIVSVPDRGRIDTVTRSLLVQAEGTEKSKSQSWLLCPQGNSVSEELELTLPGDVIEGSAQASVSVLGDILGRALQNIDGLLKMPYGCGEQNIALLSPNIYILQYLESTEQLTPAIREKATGFLKSGYQRQLNYKHYNGAYSTFGTGQGNTWLTAFVMRTFGKAQRYIFIDPENINSAKKWLLENQTPDGCYIRQGRLFNNRMKGGVNDNVTMTAYITASLLELGHTAEVRHLSSCKNYSLIFIWNPFARKVKKSIILFAYFNHCGPSVEQLSLLAYTFSLAGENEIRGQLLKKLDTVAIVGDGRLHWSRSATEDSDSLSVEISSYVLLAALSTDELSAADLGYANRIVSWLVRQQNPYGGFSSTQDTVVALQALALYSTKVYSSNGSSTVTVQSADKETHSFEVNQNNKLLYQEKSLQNVPGKYSVSVNGSTCASVQVSETHVAKNSCAELPLIQMF
uniref:Alpha-2-macroglobulin bait region domain-containing protein n=1 Tax=Astyanax mexicanus TaxID=7994 RepID=A0A8B9KH47_ASTMX